MSAQGESSPPRAQVAGASTQPAAEPASKASEQPGTAADMPITATTASIVAATIPDTPEPLKPVQPTVGGDAAIDRTNAAVLRLYGFQTAATGIALWKLAFLADADPDDEVEFTVKDETQTEVEAGAGTAVEPSTSAAAAASNTKNRGITSISAALADGTLTFEPMYFFFYGTLRDPNMLRIVCGPMQQGGSELRPARILDWRVMIWAGLYPMLVPQKGAVVEGSAWLCSDPRHVERLRRYETDNYRVEVCDIEVEVDAEGGEKKTEVIKNGRVFVSAEDTQDLEEGEFDFDSFITRHTRPMLF